MPVARIEMLEGRTREQKDILIKGVTEAICKSIGVPAKAVHIILIEVSPDNWGHEGLPFSKKD